MTTRARRALILYAEMQRTAVRGVYTGTKTSAWHATNLSNTHYTQTFDLLIEAGCIEMIYKGSPKVPAKIRLIEEPTEELINAVNLTKRKSDDTLGSRVASIEERLAGIELKEIILNFETRLAQLELDSRGMLDKQADGR